MLKVLGLFLKENLNGKFLKTSAIFGLQADRLTCIGKVFLAWPLSYCMKELLSITLFYILYSVERKKYKLADRSYLTFRLF